MNVTESQIKTLIKTVDCGLTAGLGTQEPGRMCVEAAVCYALGLPHGDNPPCVDPAIKALKILLNDAAWSSNATRAAGMRKLAVLQLGTDTGFQRSEFSERCALLVVQKVLPTALRAVDIDESVISDCESAQTLAHARSAARAAEEAARAAAWAAGATARAAGAASRWAAEAAARAARAAWVAAASEAARAAAEAAGAAAWAAWAAGAAASAECRDEVLQTFADGVVQILINMNVPAVKFLPLLETNL